MRRLLMVIQTFFSKIPFLFFSDPFVMVLSSLFWQTIVYCAMVSRVLWGKSSFIWSVSIFVSRETHNSDTFKIPRNKQRRFFYKCKTHENHSRNDLENDWDFDDVFWGWRYWWYPRSRGAVGIDTNTQVSRINDWFLFWFINIGHI